MRHLPKRILARYFRSALATFLTASFALYAFTPDLWRIEEEAIHRQKLSRDVQTFRTALSSARGLAMRHGRVLGVEVGRQGWAVYRDTGSLPWARDEGDDIMASGTWDSHTKVGTNTGRFFFDVQGLCRSGPDRICVPETWDDTAAVANEISMTSEAHRIYTVSFASDGAPVVAKDDFWP